MLIDCPYYTELSRTIPAGTSFFNCWHGSTRCKVPGQTKPICNPKKNGYKDGVFIFKVSESELNKAAKDFEYKESLVPENIVKRLNAIEKILKN